jgi:hypothetical protein
MPRPTIDITGQRFDKLVVTEFAGYSNSNGHARWQCHCDCGKTTIVYAKYLLIGDTSSCGCKTLKHGYGSNGKEHYLYRTWARMRERCNNPAHKFFKYYGGRGINVCDRWNDFAIFLADILTSIGERPPGHTLDRIDNDDNYNPGNVRWATPKQQAQNRRERPHNDNSP